MVTRQEQLLDAAIELIGTQGIRSLTHRAVDAEAGIPAGSTSNYYRTRDALLEAIVARFAERERLSWEAIAGAVQPSSPKELAAALEHFVRDATGPSRALTLTRQLLFAEAAQRPSLQPVLASNAKAIRAWGAQWLKAVGSAHPERDCQIVLNYLDGLIIHQLAFPETPFSPARPLLALLKALIAS